MADESENRIDQEEAEKHVGDLIDAIESEGWAIETAEADIDQSELTGGRRGRKTLSVTLVAAHQDYGR